VDSNREAPEDSLRQQGEEETKQKAKVIARKALVVSIRKLRLHIHPPFNLPERYGGKSTKGF
jgi:hypothetical protein